MKSNILQRVLRELDEHNVTRKISSYHNAAIATFAMPTKPPRNHAEFEDTIIRFISHQFAASLKTDSTVTLPREIALARAHAAISDWQEAARNAIYDTNGGIREILNHVWRKLREEQEAQYIEMALDRIVPRLDFDTQVQLAKEILREFGRYLPPDMRTQSPYLIAANYRKVVHILTAAITHIRKPLSGWEPEHVQ